MWGVIPDFGRALVPIGIIVALACGAALGCSKKASSGVSRMRALTSDALESDLVSIGSYCNDCGTTDIEWIRDDLTKDDFSRRVVLATTGEAVQTRDCPAATTLVRWFLAVQRDTFDPFAYP
jgi:hypothetical protein